MAADKAVAALREQVFPAHKLDAVAHAIAAHSFSAGIAPQTMEAKIVQDADRPDAMGPVGIARMFSVGGQLGRALALPTDPLAQQRPLDDGAYMLEHIAVKLGSLPASMQTAAGKRLGEERMAWIRRFRADFLQQWLPQEQA